MENTFLTILVSISVLLNAVCLSFLILTGLSIVRIVDTVRMIRSDQIQFFDSLRYKGKVQKPKSQEKEENSGLIELQNSGTYDPRFNR